MSKGDMYMTESGGSKKNSGCKGWQVWITCSLLIAIGLGVGLGVGLSNMNKADNAIVVTDPPPVVVTTTTSSETTNPTPDVANYRLPSEVVPFHYELKLHPNMSTDTYTGTNAMSVNVSQEVKNIIFHVDEKVDIASTKVERFENAESVGSMIETRAYRYLPNEFWVVEADSTFAPTTGDEFYKVTVEFSGSLIGRIVGLYKSTYVDPTTGEEKAMVGSDMEPTDARKAYPCFDEPALKVRYATTLVHEPQHTALSNMDVKQVTNRADGLSETEFNPSVPMSTYLGCFAVSEFEYSELFSEKNNISLRVYVPPHQKAAGQAEYALGILKKAFDYFEDLFDMDYPLPKLDMISIPNFGTGAMENWGLITYRETNLILDPLESSTSNRQRVAQVVAHELVHQWFGNVVTMKWWDNLWLNEGFASYFEYRGQQAAEPDWQILDQFVTDDLQPVLRSDDTVTSHPIVVDVSTPSQITSVFDTISYSKGASVLRVMRDILGEDHFIGGLRYYLKQRKFANANEADLWHDVQEYLDSRGLSIDIAEIMNPWVLQMGYPVINVSSTYDAHQEHFLTDPNADLDQRPTSEYNYKWNVEVSYITENSRAPVRKILELNGGDVNLNVTDAGAWIKLNPGQQGYYRVRYDDAMLASVSQQLETNHTVFGEIDRCNLIDDTFNLAPGEYITYTQALNLTQYLNRERSYFVWDAFSSGSSYIRVMLENSGDTATYQMFKDYYRSKVKPTADELGWDATLGTHIEKLNRYLVLALALRYDDPEALGNATTLFNQWINDASYYLYPDTRSLVYRYGIVTASTEEWERMLERYVAEPVASEKTNLLRGLTSTEDVQLIDRMLELTKNESVIKSQDFFTAVEYVSYTPTGNRMAWSWVQLNWEYMVERFGLTDRSFGRLVPNIVSDYNTKLQLWEVESFFAKHPDAGAGASGRVSAVNSIESNIAWIGKNRQPIAAWLESALLNAAV